MSDFSPEEARDLVTERQDEAVAEFKDAAIAGEFSELELLSGMVTVEHLGSGADTVLPLTRKPEATAKLFEAWQKILETNSFPVFEDEVEDMIDRDETVQTLLPQRARKTNEDDYDFEKRQEPIKRGLMRQRFAIWGSYHAILAALEEDKNPAPESDTTLSEAG